MKEKIDSIKAEATEALRQADNQQKLQDVRVRFLGKNGTITALLKEVGKADPGQRAEMGKLINEIKGFAQRQAQAKGQQGQQGDPKDAAKVQAIGLKAQVGAQIKQKQFEAKQRERMIEFQLDQSRENMKLIAEIKREDLSHKQELLNDSLERTIMALRGVNEGENSSK